MEELNREDSIPRRDNENDSRATRLPTLRVGTAADALAPHVLETLSTADLATFLAKRRWFGAKAGSPSAARIRDVVKLEWEGGTFALARVEVAAAGGGTPSLYQLPLCVRTLEEIGDAMPKSVLARVTVQGAEEALLFDAVEDGAFLRAFAGSFAKGGTFGIGGLKWIAAPTSSTPLVIPPTAPIRVGSAEQSNTSVIIDQLAILKLFRKLESGEHPDVEVTRYLTIDAGFAHTPVLLGVAHFTGDGADMVAAMLQEYLPKSVDAWSFGLECARPYFEAPAGREPANGFLTHAEHLGSITRELHEALAQGTSPPFAPELVTREQLSAWAAGARDWITKGTALLERQLGTKAIPKERFAEADALVRRREHFIASIAEIVDDVASDAGAAIRIHGDYHLGQVLRTARDDFMIIDFEGEPLRSLEERRRKASPLRDVAGMLRSFAYAAATLGMEAKKLDMPTRELRAGRWERDAREAFLRGYLREQGSRILPSDTVHTRALLRLFETEKAFYELAYELNNRPDWVWIPMRGIAKLLGR